MNAAAMPWSYHGADDCQRPFRFRKTVALRALEDMGFYCVDNLPVVLLPQLANTLAERNISAAVSIDVRNMPESPEVFNTR